MTFYLGKSMQLQQAVYDPSAESDLRWIWSSEHADLASLPWRETRDAVMRAADGKKENHFTGTIKDSHTGREWLYLVLRGGVDRMGRPGRYLILMVSPFLETTQSPAVEEVWGYFIQQMRRAADLSKYYAISSPASFTGYPYSEMVSSCDKDVLRRYFQSVEEENKHQVRQPSNDDTHSQNRDYDTDHEPDAVSVSKCSSSPVEHFWDYLCMTNVKWDWPVLQPSTRYIEKYYMGKIDE